MTCREKIFRYHNPLLVGVVSVLQLVIRVLALQTLAVLDLLAERKNDECFQFIMRKRNQIETDRAGGLLHFK